MSDALFDLPDSRIAEPRERPEWRPWTSERTTCDDCALSIGTQQSVFAAEDAALALLRVDGTVGAYCVPHAREKAIQELGK